MPFRFDDKIGLGRVQCAVASELGSRPRATDERRKATRTSWEIEATKLQPESQVVHRILHADSNQLLPPVSSPLTVFSRQRVQRNQHMVWDDETIGLLRDLWMQGHSTAEIGRRLGVSKNAIVGKAHRLELDARPSPIRRDAVKPATERPLPYPRFAGPTLPPLASTKVQAFPAPSNVQPLRPVPPLSPRPVAPPPAAPLAPRPLLPSAPVQSRRSTPSCCWPIGEPGTKTFRFCDDLSVPGKPYCDEHAKLAYVRIRDRKEDAA
jgi:GcrA cell cycle regulator